MAVTNATNGRPKALARRRPREVLAGRNIGLLALLIALWIALASISPFFFNSRNILLLLLQSSTTATVAIGMTLVIISGGIDLSVGGVAALAGMVTGILLMKAQLGFLVSVVGGLSAGLVAGAINGVIVSRFKLQPMVVTLGMMSVARGLTLTSTSGRPIFVLDPLLSTIGGGKVGPVPIPVIIALVVFVIGYIVLNYTEFGRYIYAVGGNEEATRLSGIPVARYKVEIYMISGFCAALTGILLVGLLGASEPTVGLGMELDAIAVAAIGGTSLMGGVGGVVGTLMGAILIGTLKNGMTLLNIVSYYQQVLIGIIIILAVLFDRIRQG